MYHWEILFPFCSRRTEATQMCASKVKLINETSARRIFNYYMMMMMMYIIFHGLLNEHHLRQCFHDQMKLDKAQ